MPVKLIDDNYIKLDLSSYEKNVEYVFQIAYMTKNQDVISNIETYIFKIKFV